MFCIRTSCSPQHTTPQRIRYERRVSVNNASTLGLSALSDHLIGLKPTRGQPADTFWLFTNMALLAHGVLHTMMWSHDVWVSKQIKVRRTEDYVGVELNSWLYTVSQQSKCFCRCCCHCPHDRELGSSSHAYCITMHHMWVWILDMSRQPAAFMTE